MLWSSQPGGAAPRLAVVCGLAVGPRTPACQRVAHYTSMIELGETRPTATRRPGA